MRRGVLLLALAGVVVASIAAAAFVGAVGPSGATASSHREAPLIGDDPAVDNTDLYAFVSPERPNTVTIIANYIPFEDPAGGPNYYRFDPTARYEIHVDNDGDARPDITYRFRFKTTVSNPNTFLYNTGQVTFQNDPDLNVKQTYTIEKISRIGRARRRRPPTRFSGGARQHRPALEPGLQPDQGRHQRSAATGWPLPARATTRSSSTSGRSSTSGA